MSIILEALRKAEASRRGDDRLGLAATPVRRVPLYARIPVGFVAAAAMLFLSVGVGAWLLWPEEPQESAAVASREPTGPPASAPTHSGGVAGPSPEEEAPPAETAMSSTAPATSPDAATAPADAAETAPRTGTPPATGSTSAPAKPGSHADVRMLSMEARLAEPPAPTASAPTRGGSVEVRDLLGPGADAETAPQARSKPIKPGSVEVRDLLAEQGVEPVAPDAQEDNAAGVLSEADGGVRQPDESRAATARPASAARTSGAPPAGAALPEHAAPPMPRSAPDVPSLDELVASGQLNPPDLSLDMHAYGPEAASRFVYINMRRYHVGDTTREGAVVEDITPDGVVLQMQGRRFVLSAR
jgi:hypothetical protein